jgi:hypothetical protein
MKFVGPDTRLQAKGNKKSALPLSCVKFCTLTRNIFQHYLLLLHRATTTAIQVTAPVPKITVIPSYICKHAHTITYKYVEVAVEVNLLPTVSRPVCLGVRLPSGTFNQFFFLLEISFRFMRVCYFVAPSLTRGRVCNLLYNCFWALPEQSLLSRSPAELTTIFYCLI